MIHKESCPAYWSGQDEQRYRDEGCGSCTCIEPEWKEIHSKEELKPFYLSLLPKITAAARACGYAVGFHGSLMRDFDLIAVPWVDVFSHHDVLVEQIQKAACGFTMSKYQWEQKPNGRIATAFPICWVDYSISEPSIGHIDLSVINQAAKFGYLPPEREE